MTNKLEKPELDKQAIVKEILERKDVQISYDTKWRWFHNRDDSNTCPLLAFMLEVEYKSGVLIFLPDKENKCKMVDRNKD